MIQSLLRTAWRRRILEAFAFVAAAALPLLAARPFDIAAQVQILETAHAGIERHSAKARPLLLDPWTYAAHAETIPAAESEFASILQSVADQRGVAVSRTHKDSAALEAPGLFALREELAIEGDYAALARTLSDLAAIRPYILVERAEIERGEAGAARAKLLLLRVVATRAPS